MKCRPHVVGRFCPKLLSYVQVKICWQSVMYNHQMDAKMILDNICDRNINKLGQKSELDNHLI